MSIASHMGQLTASIAHEVNQPVAAVVTNADAALRWLGTQPLDLENAREALGFASAMSAKGQVYPRWLQ